MDAKTQQQYARTFHNLHRKGEPLILFNAWDVATAKAIAKTSPAVATSSAAVASALGFADGEDVPFDMVTSLVSRITAAVSVPVSIDLEAGYGDTPDAAAESAMPLHGCRSATPQGLRTTCTVACSIAMGCPDPKRAYRGDMPLVDNVHKIWRG
jgi:hypothetical protein